MDDLIFWYFFAGTYGIEYTFKLEHFSLKYNYHFNCFSYQECTLKIAIR